MDDSLFTINTEDVDVEEIINSIRSSIEKRGVGKYSFADIDRRFNSIDLDEIDSHEKKADSLDNAGIDSGDMAKIDSGDIERDGIRANTDKCGDDSNYERDSVDRLGVILEIERKINVARSLVQINIYEPIYSHRKLLGPFLILFRKVTRRLLRWYIMSITEQQSLFNEAVVNALSEINKKLSSLDTEAMQ